MIDEMPNATLIAHAKDNEDATELELELADRLESAMAEIAHLVAELRQKEAVHG